MKALTICNPYPHLIVLGEKPVENRKWAAPEKHWGTRIGIHAGASKAWMRPEDAARFPVLAYSALVGTAVLWKCVKRGDVLDGLYDPEFPGLSKNVHVNGPWCWILKDVRRFTIPIPCKGKLGLWEIPADIQRLVDSRETTASTKTHE